MRPDGTFAVNHEKIKDGVAALTREIMTMQARGDYAKAKALGERLGNVRPPVQAALDKLADVPVDIEPRYVTAEQLLKRVTAQSLGRKQSLVASQSTSRNVESHVAPFLEERHDEAQRIDRHRGSDDGCRRAGAAGADPAVLARIRTEGMDRSQTLPVFEMLTTDIGPRLTASPAQKRASEFVRDRLTSYGL